MRRFSLVPLVLWNWNDHAADKAKAVLELAAQLPDVLVIPMPDYRPKYPKVEPEEVINPNHPNLTIWGNKIEACIFYWGSLSLCEFDPEDDQSGDQLLDLGHLRGARS